MTKHSRKQPSRQTPLHLSRPFPHPVLLPPLRPLLRLRLLGSDLGSPLCAPRLERVLRVEPLTDEQPQPHPLVAEERRRRVKKVPVQSAVLRMDVSPQRNTNAKRKTHLVYRPQRPRRHLDLYPPSQQRRVERLGVHVWEPRSAGFFERVWDVVAVLDGFSVEEA